jgi:predicted choloylglycine hydrolase
LELLFTSIDEAQAGAKWQALFQRHWPAYEQWFLSEGIEARPTYLVARRQLEAHMPELLPTYERLCELAGGGDLAARCLGLYSPPAYLTGCSQVVWPGADPWLVRNYDYAPHLCEGVILRSAWNGRRVVAMLDSLWGALDGVNEAGLAVSLTFGGRRVVGEGFGVPLILRYILEFCETAREAGEVMARVPCHMAYNVTAVDRRGRFMTAFVAPDRPAIIRQVPIAANHQGRIDWHSYARATATLERERYLFFRLREDGMTPERLVDYFFRPPLYTRAYENGFGTLYTAIYRPATGEASYAWPDGRWTLGLEQFEEAMRPQRFRPAPVEPSGSLGT